MALIGHSRFLESEDWTNQRRPFPPQHLLLTCSRSKSEELRKQNCFSMFCAENPSLSHFFQFDSVINLSMSFVFVCFFVF